MLSLCANDIDGRLCSAADCRIDVRPQSVTRGLESARPLIRLPAVVSRQVVLMNLEGTCRAKNKRAGRCTTEFSIAFG